MTIAALITARGPRPAPIRIGPDAALADAVALLARHRIGALLVMEGEHLSGILSERDIVRGLARSADIVRRGRVRDLMTAEVFVCHPEETVTGQLARMMQKRIRHLPVVDADGRVIAVVSIGDLAGILLDPVARAGS
jgi:CBS domain-containing protein